MEEPGFPLTADGTQKPQAPSRPSGAVGIHFLACPGDIQYPAPFRAPVIERVTRAGRVEVVGLQGFECRQAA